MEDFEIGGGWKKREKGEKALECKKDALKKDKKDSIQNEQDQMVRVQEM